MKKLYFSFVATAGLLSMVFLFQNCGEFDSEGNPLGSSDRSVASVASVSIAADGDANAVAISLYRRIAGVTLPTDDPTIRQMEVKITDGDLLGAATLATESPNFLNVTVRDFATKMATREQTVSGELDDFVATVMGSVRDDVSADQLLTGNFFYYGEGQGNEDMMADLVTSNNHYTNLDDNVEDIGSTLVRVDGQQVRGPGGALVDLADPAGLMTTRGWMQEHAIAGTNRRMIEYAFKIFMCTPIEDWASLRDPLYIGRDVPRFGPGANGNQDTNDFDNTCRSCHSGMGALRPATAFFDFVEDDDNGDYIAYRYPSSEDPNPLDEDNPVNVPDVDQQRMVPYKFRRGIEANGANPPGFPVVNDQWTNIADDAAGASLGFRSSESGAGMSDFGRLVAQSKQFSRCMAKRVFSTVCRQDLGEDADDFDILERMADRFEDDGRNLKNLFINVSVHPSCIGLGG